MKQKDIDTLKLFVQEHEEALESDAKPVSVLNYVYKILEYHKYGKEIPKDYARLGRAVAQEYRLNKKQLEQKRKRNSLLAKERAKIRKERNRKKYLLGEWYAIFLEKNIMNPTIELYKHLSKKSSNISELIIDVFSNDTVSLSRFKEPLFDCYIFAAIDEINKKWIHYAVPVSKSEDVFNEILLMSFSYAEVLKLCNKMRTELKELYNFDELLKL